MGISRRARSPFKALQILNLTRPKPMAKSSVDDLDLKVVITRIRERMTALDTNPSAVSRKARLGTTAVHDILNGKNLNPRVPALKRIAAALDCTLAYLVGEEDLPRSPGTGVLEAAPVPVIGIAEAGAFRAMANIGHEHERDLPQVFAPPSRMFPSARRFALEVRGDSMNAAKPVPIVEGMLVCCIDVIDAGLAIESGRIYAIRRTLDGGHTYECTIKRAKVFRDRVELSSESTNPNHKTIIVPRDFDSAHTNEYAAIGLVYAAVNSFESI